MSISKPIVSIIVPNYNHENFLRKRLDSIFNQTFKDFEVILLDDASTDGSSKILADYEEHPKVSYLLINEENSSSTFQQWNKGIRRALGEYIWIAESDDYSDKRFLETMMELFDREKDVDMVFCASWYVNEKNTILKPAPDMGESFIVLGLDVLQKYFSKYNLIRNASSCVFKRKLINPIYYEFAYFQYCGDWQFWTDLASRAWKIAYVSDKLNYFRIHKQNVSTEAEKQGLYFREGFRILDGILRREKITKENKDQIFRYWGLKLYEAIFSKKDIYLGIKLQILVQSLFIRNQIFRYTLWNHKTKIKLKNILWRKNN